MATVSLQLSDEEIKALTAQADALGLSLEAYLHQLINERLTTREARLRRAMDYVLEKNHALYERLS